MNTATKDGVDLRGFPFLIHRLWRITSTTKEVVCDVGIIDGGDLCIEKADKGVKTYCAVSNYYFTRRAALEAALAQEVRPARSAPATDDMSDDERKALEEATGNG